MSKTRVRINVICKQLPTFILDEPGASDERCVTLEGLTVVKFVKKSCHGEFDESK